MSAAAAAPVESRVTVVSFSVAPAPDYYDPAVICANLYAVFKRLGYRNLPMQNQLQTMMLEHDLGVTREAIVRELEKGAGGTSFVLPQLPEQPGSEPLQVKSAAGKLARRGLIYLVG